MPSTGLRNHGPYVVHEPAAPRPSARPARIPLCPSNDRDSRSDAGRRHRTASRILPARLAALLDGHRVERARIGEAQQDARPRVTRADVERDEHRPLVGQRLTRAAVGAPERRVVGGYALLKLPCGQCSASFSYSCGSAGSNAMPARCAGGTATMTALAATSPRSVPTTRVPSAAVRWFARPSPARPDGPVLRPSAARSAGCHRKAVLLSAALDVEHAAEPPPP